MSNLSGTYSEVFYSVSAVSTQLNTFTTEANLMQTYSPCLIPAQFFYDVRSQGKRIRVRAVGRLGTTGAPTFTWSVRLLTSSTWSAAGIAFSTAALTAGTTQTLAPWFLDFELTFRTMGAAGANSTVSGLGEVRGPLALASPFAGTIPGNNTAYTAATFDASVNAYLFISAACGTSNALNLIQMEEMEVRGEN